MNLMIVPGMFVCSSFLISVCMFIVSKALLISSATVIRRVWKIPYRTHNKLVHLINKSCSINNVLEKMSIKFIWT